MTNNKTVGEEAVARLSNPDTKQGIIDTEREVNKDYFEEIQKCVDSHRAWTDPFYVVIHYKKEKTLHNVIRRYFLARQTLPTPQWGQDVWQYNPKSGDVRYLWTLPDEQTAMWMVANPQDVPSDQHVLLAFILDFLDGKLYRMYEKEFLRGSEACNSDTFAESAQLVSAEGGKTDT